MDQKQANLMQFQLRHNSEDLQDFIKDLDGWESEIKQKDESLSKQKPILKEQLPPVRNHRAPRPKKRKKKAAAEKQPDTAASERISSYDYHSWDQFDVDKACEEVDYQVQSSGEEEDGEGGEGGEGSSGEEDGDEQLEEERRRQQAIMEKDKGNAHFKKGEFELSVESYSSAMQLDPHSAVLPANRAMALIKLQRYAAAEVDCSMSLLLDSSYVKAYHRRGVTRTHLNKLIEAKNDFQAVLKYESGNKMAKSEIAKLEKLMAQRGDVTTSGKAWPQKQKKSTRYVTAVQRPPHLRAKKPLKRVMIEDIGGLVNESENNVIVTPTTQECKTNTTTNTTTRLNHTTSTTKDTEISNSPTSIPPEKAKSAQASSTPASAASPELKLPEVPSSSLQFQADWKRLKNSPKLLSQYFKSLPLPQYPALLQQSLETDVFTDVITILHEDYVKCGKLCVEELQWLSKVKRFSVSVMFLSRKGKDRLQELFSDLNSLHSGTPELCKLAKLYGVSIPE